MSTSPEAKPHIRIRGGDVDARAHSQRGVASLLPLLLGSPERSSVPILRGVDLDVEPGDRLGIVGGNGAGKTSLLKVIAGIYPLVRGEREVVGSIAPLIQRGLGFDDDLTVRQNIRLGLIYSGQVRKSQDERIATRIIEFAELAGFENQPLKVLSSGMKARLSFAASLFQEPDILLLDEVFATGDARFKQIAEPALMEQLDSSPIVVLVSHSEELVRRTCNRAILIEGGRVVCDGKTDEVLERYAEHSR